jgi:ABC-type uncharacterized transport system YnjBCD permease subunit
MNPQGGDLLSQLRDIHAAPAVPWWPPAPGWWLLALVVAICLFYVLRYAVRRLRSRQRRLALIRYVDHVENSVDPLTAPQEFLSSLNRIFKIVALRAFPDSHCAYLQGEEWVQFVQSKLKAADTANELEALAQGPYQMAAVFDAQRLVSTARKWVRQYG